MLILAPSLVKAQYALFDQKSDTISLAGQTNLGSSVTYEAQILFSGTYQGEGNIFNEWTNAAEDKMFRMGPNRLLGFSFPAGGPGVLSLPASVPLDQWHHVAYVFDGSADRLYLDGTLVGSRVAIGSTGNASGLPFLGAIPRDSIVVDSFVGFIDSFRLSSVVRYTGTTFTPPVGDLASDANTVMLFNFNEAAGSTVLNDLSGNGHNGVLGVGFGGATSPEFVTAVPEPSTWMLILAILIGVVGYKLFSRAKLFNGHLKKAFQPTEFSFYGSLR